MGSGSAGNSVVVDAEGSRVLLDAGFSCREIVRRLDRVGVEPSTLSGVVLTHEHGDHCRGAEQLGRRFDLPIFGTRGTLEGCRFSKRAGGLRLVPISSAVPFRVGTVELRAFPVPHDAREPVGLIVEDRRRRRLGLVTDLGSSTREALRCLRDLDVLVQESNHDLEMLRDGPYPWALKRRVMSEYGHLSNRQAAEGIADLVCDRLQWVVLYHLSQTNNLPALAATEVGEELDRVGSAPRVLVASQAKPTPWLEVRT